MKVIRILGLVFVLFSVGACKKGGPEPPAGQECPDSRECVGEMTSCICDEAGNLIYNEGTERGEPATYLYTYSDSQALLTIEIQSGDRHELCTLNSPCELWPEPGPAYDPGCFNRDNQTCETVE